MTDTTQTTAQPSAAIPPDDSNRKLTVVDPNNPSLRQLWWLVTPIRSWCPVRRPAVGTA